MTEASFIALRHAQVTVNPTILAIHLQKLLGLPPTHGRHEPETKRDLRRILRILLHLHEQKDRLQHPHIPANITRGHLT